MNRLALATALLCPLAGAGTIELFPGGNLRAALQGLVAGDELIIHDGSYSTQATGGSYFLAVTWNGTVAQPIQVRAAAGARPVISGDFSQNVINIDGMDMTNVAGQDFWPSADSTLLGAADALYAAADFNGTQRPASDVDAGAYQRVAAANPG